MYNEELDTLLKSNEFYAHIDKSGLKEPLLKHMELTLEYFNKINDSKHLETIIRNIIKSIDKNISKEVENKVMDLYIAAIYYHDIGKINPNFQTIKMGNKMETKIIGSHHSILSARLYINTYRKEIEEEEKFSSQEKVQLILFIYQFAFIISRHHSKIEKISDFLDNLAAVELPEICVGIKSYNDDLFKKRVAIYEKLGMQHIEIYILNKLLYSCIVSADYYATYEFINKDKVKLLEKKDDLFLKYKNSELFKNINMYKEGSLKISGINKIRSDIFLEAEERIKKNNKNNIFFLEAPTGSGKTNTSINLARILYENFEDINSVNYIFPFNNLIEQTDEVLQKYFNKNKDYTIINSIASIFVDDMEEEKEKPDYDKAYINNLFRNFPIKLTSHVNFFSTLFGIVKQNNYSFLDYINSVVIIDEIQAYNNQIWREFFVMFEKYAKLLNIKFIIMSATLPDLTYLSLDEKIDNIKLLENASKYYDMDIFKNRVKLEYALLNEKITLEKLKNKVIAYKGKKILIEFIDKKSAREFYNLIKEDAENVYEITGDDNNFERKKILSKINTLDDVIVVATQTIEAGVDIDMDIGFKDISFIDSEEQFLGRINRSSTKKDCIAYFFNYKNSNVIYKNDKRLNMDLTNIDYQKLLTTKKFNRYFEDLMNKIKKSTDRTNENNIENFLEKCISMKYEDVDDKLKLIDSKTRQIFLNYEYEYKGEIISGETVWEDYKSLCMQNMPYSEKQILISRMREKLNLFIYNIYSNTDSSRHYTEEFCGIYYIQNGDEFIVDGKFDRSKYAEFVGGIFL